MKISTFLYTLFLLVAASVLPAQLRAQSFQLPTSGTASYTTCAGTLYDDGGPGDAYALDTKGSVTLFPGTAGSKLRLEFTVLELDSLHTNLTIYDGPDTSYPKIDRFYHGLPTVYATGSTGALTVVLTASGGLPLPGFAATIGCVTSIPPPDLAVQGLQLMCPTALAGEYVRSTARIANLSGAKAATILQYFLSTDTKQSPDDRAVYSTDLAVTTGSWMPAERYLPVPNGTAPGTYYLLCVAQVAWGSTAEINTANNLAYTTLTVVQPTPNVDLVPTYADYSSDYQQAPGTSLFTAVEVQNRAQAPSVAFQIGYYLSADAILGPDDTLLDTTPAKAIAASKFSLVYGSVSIPPTASPGTYYLLCVVDYLDEVIEDNEQNNTLALKLVIPPLTLDVGFDAYHTLATNQPAPGGNVTVGCILRNMGSIPLDSATVAFYLSADQQLSADDVLLGHASSGALWPGNSYYGFVSRTLTIPATTPLGKRYLLLVADYRNQLAERNEKNNLLPLPLDVVVPDVDLVVSSARPYAPVAGNTLPVDCLLTNKGTTAAYPTSAGYYLSTDTQLSPDDLLLGQTLSVLVAGKSDQQVNNIPVPLIIPAATVPGTYYLLCVADYLHQVAEADEENNVLAVLLQVVKPSPDLTLTSSFEVTPASLAAGTETQVSYHFTNAGTTAAYATRVGFYLSTDTVLGPNDVYVGVNSLSEWNAIYPSTTNDFLSKVVIPRTTAPGRYYLLGVADDLNEFVETNETNNVRYAPIEVTAARPDLALQAGPYLSPRLAVAGSQVTTESYVNNVGFSLATASAVGYYLSTDSFLSPNDILLGSTPTPEVRLGYSAIVTGTFTVPAATAGGRYYVLFVADYLNQVNDLTSSNNIGYTTLTVNPLSLATREQTAGYELRVGPVPVSSGNPLRVQLSGPGARTEASLGLYNNLGQLLTTRSVTLMPGQNNQVALPTTGLAAGVYMLRLTGPSLNAVRRLVVE